MRHHTPCTLQQLMRQIKLWGTNLNLDQIGFTSPNLALSQTAAFKAWLAHGNQGTMQFMSQHKELRFNPQALMPDVKTIICCRLNYLPLNHSCHNNRNNHTHPNATNPSRAAADYIAAYAQGRDYHTIMRKRLSKLAQHIEAELGAPRFRYRVCCDSAPVMEKALALQSGLGWVGKNTLVVNEYAGSYFFLGEIYTNLDLGLDSLLGSKRENLSGSGDEAAITHPASRCGGCTACLDACPTRALYAPYHLDARRCIAYLTIEHQGSIPEELRPLIGTNIFGCNTCQQCCPWNKSVHQAPPQNLVHTAAINPFTTLPQWNNTNLAQLFLWSEENYLTHTAGTPLRRLGYTRWLRNLAVALGNEISTPENLSALQQRCNYPDTLVREHVEWARRKTEAGNRLRNTTKNI